MKKLKIIVAVDNKWGIGKKNDLLFKLKQDMKFFTYTTWNQTVIMGGNTLKSLPGGKGLKNRTNFVLWPEAEPGIDREDCIIAYSMSELAELVKGLATPEAYIIGGAMMYKTMLPYCTEALITKVEADGGAEVFFDNLDDNPDWELVKEGEPIEDNGYMIRFTTYKNKNPRDFVKEMKNK
ncbi:MAG: dihydrofolate reductase [Clostridia bacterium]|nr:dihydrofolate reductase [Clostridia bacterium]